MGESVAHFRKSNRYCCCRGGVSFTIPSNGSRAGTASKTNEARKAGKQVKDASVAPAHIQMTDMLEQYIELQHEKTVSRAKPLKYVSWVVQYSKDTDIDSVWILAMMWQESRMLEESESSHGAIGLLQILPSTAKSFGVSKQELHQPETNIRTSIIYLEYLMDKYDGNIRTATIAYNQGRAM